MENLIIDTDVLIDYLRQPQRQTLLGKLLKKKRVKITIAAVTLTELWRGRSIERPKEKLKVEKLLCKLKIVIADEKISKLVGELLRNYSHLMLADCLVAATTIVLKGKLVTFNQKHFQSIRKLVICSDEAIQYSP